MVISIVEQIRQAHRARLRAAAGAELTAAESDALAVVGQIDQVDVLLTQYDALSKRLEALLASKTIPRLYEQVAQLETSLFRARRAYADKAKELIDAGEELAREKAMTRRYSERILSLTMASAMIIHAYERAAEQTLDIYRAPVAVKAVLDLLQRVREILPAQSSTQPGS